MSSFVPGGGVESWLPTADVPGHGFDWLTAMFGKMGSDTSVGGFMRPTAGDVWAFVDRVAAWLERPDRKGM